MITLNIPRRLNGFLSGKEGSRPGKEEKRIKVECLELLGKGSKWINEVVAKS